MVLRALRNLERGKSNPLHIQGRGYSIRMIVCVCVCVCRCGYVNMSLNIMSQQQILLHKRDVNETGPKCV